jgi:hypothetical protein
MESGSAAFDIADHLRLRSGWCRLSYYRSRRVGEAVTIDNEPLYVLHSSTESGRVVALLEAIEGNGACPLAAA